MKLPLLRKIRRGFTLIELLTVIAIIGILAAMVVPAVGLVKKKAMQLAAQNNASSIAKSYYAYCFSDPTPHNFNATLMASSGSSGINGWALLLASRANMNLADPWFIKTDDALGMVNTYPQQVADLTNPNKPILDSTFANTSPKSWYVVQGATKNDSNASTYPIVWTRGLTAGQTYWDKTTPWGGEGGHIGFLDGHTIWVKSTLDADSGLGIFQHYVTRKATSSVSDAVGVGAQNMNVSILTN